MAGSTIEYTAQTVENLRDMIKQKALEKAIETKVVASEDDAVVRDLLPSDLGATDEVFKQTLNTAGAYNTIYNTDLDDKKIVVIYGAVVPSGTNSTAIKFNLGNAKVIDIVEIEKAKYLQNPVVIFDPILYNKSATVKIEFYCPQGVTTPADDNVVLLGLVVEPKGKTISPDSE